MNMAPTALIEALATAPDEVVWSRLLREGARHLLADPKGCTEVLIMVVDAADEGRARAAAELLSAVLDEARMAAENDAPEGDALLGAVEAALVSHDAARPLAPVLRLRLAQIYASAGLAPPSIATLTADPVGDTGPASLDMPDLGALLDPILQEIGDAPLQVHSALTELLAGLPDELAAMLVSMTIARPGAVEPRLGLYWLLNPKPEIRLAAATALLARTGAGTLAPDLAALLPAIRKWLPDGPARSALDGAIRSQIRQGQVQADAPAVTLHRAAASLPDGAGAQSLIAAVQIGGRRFVAMAMLKQGHGVKDAFIIPCASATAQRQMLASILDEIEAFDVTPGALTEVLARGLGEGLALDRLPAPGTVDFAEMLGHAELAPSPAAAEDILRSIGAADALAALPAAHRTALVRASADWIRHFDQADSWFEDTGALRAAIGRARSETGREKAVWKHLETRRGWWARHSAVSAATLKHAAGLDPALWLSFAAVAQALMDGASLKRIPIMADILETTLEAYAAEHEDAPTPQSGTGKDAGTMLARAGITDAYLQGYLTALAIAPRAPSPQDWLGALLGGIEFPGEGAIDRVMAFLTSAMNHVDDEACDPASVARSLDALDDDGLRDWAAGFDALMTATRGSWPARLLAADDKRVLREISQIAKGSDGQALRKILPSWTARRHAMRR